MKKILSILFATLFLFSLVSRGQEIDSGPEIGTELCSCSPSTYEFTLDFDLSCPPVNITIGNAVQATSCITSPYGDPDITDLVPVAVTSITILEMGQELMVVSQTNINKELLNGDTVTYSSIAADPNSITNAKVVPRAIQINLEGKNVLDQKIINVFIITFTNGCGSYPVFEEGQSAGWMRFTGIGPASNELCAAATTSSPTMSPISLAPPAPDTDTTVPVMALKDPTDNPTTSKPSPGTSVPVVEIPTDPPATISMSMSMSMSMSFDIAPTNTPTLSPTSAVTLSPTDVTTSSPTMSPISLAPPAPDTDTTVPAMALKDPTDNPTTSKPSPGTSVPVVEIPTDPPATISMSMYMSMSMSMSLDILQVELEDAIRPNSREFGDWKDEIGGDDSMTSKKKNSRRFKGLKGKGDDDDDDDDNNKNSKGDKKSSKVDRALKGEHDKKDKASTVTRKLGGKVRCGNT